MLSCCGKKASDLLFQFHSCRHILLWMLNYSLDKDVGVVKMYRFAT